MSTPKTIFTEPLNRGIIQKVFMNGEEFLNLVLTNKINIIFSCPHENSTPNNYLYIVKEGIFFCTNSYQVKNFEMLDKAVNNFEVSGFERFEKYTIAVRFGINDLEEFRLFERSKFLNPNNDNSYNEFLDHKKGGFSNKTQYDQAKSLGISNNDEFLTFLNSSFDNDYNSYLKAKELGFSQKEDYRKAMGLGLNNSEEYKEFLNSGCETREEFDFFKKRMPHIIKDYEKKIDQVIKDAIHIFKSRNYGEFIRLKFLSIEILSKLLYLKLFRRDIQKENDFKVDDAISQIEEELDKKLVDFEELKYWRRIRNKIAHEHLEVDENKAEKGKEFFDELYNNLKKYS